MSRTKTFVFDRLPEDDALRSELSRRLSDRASEFPERIPTRRRNPQGRPQWDPLWPACLHAAADELGVETMQINDGVYLKTSSERAEVYARAEALLAERRARLFGR